MIEVDRSEPHELAQYISPVHEVTVTSLNDSGWADLYWTGAATSEAPEGEYQTERKTWTNMIGDLDEIEDLLRRQHLALPKAKHRLIIEGGGIEPWPVGVLLHSVSKGRMVAHPHGTHRGMFKAIYGRITSWSDYVEIIPTASLAATAIAVVELYEHDQKPEEDRTTFRRHFKSIDWSPNPQVEGLMGMCGREIKWGPTICERLILRFGTRWAVCSASPQQLAQVEGISVDGATTFLRKIGRLDV